MNTNSEFSKRSREVAGRFLQTAVVIEDQPHFEEKIVPLVEPSRAMRVGGIPSAGAPQAGDSLATHDLDAKRLIDAFAELGVVCAVLKPELEASPEGTKAPDTIKTLGDRTSLATKRADVVILDWNIPPETKPGMNAKRLMRKILKADESPQGTRTDNNARRLRLFAIYTGESDLDAITADLESLLTELELGDVDRGAYCIKGGPVTISIYGKGNPTIQTEDVNRRVGEDDLPGCLLDDFTKMTEGLLSNVALEALSAIRTNTHRLLRRFNSGIDAPYVAHRAMTEPPEEAEEHPVPLIAAEIEGVLADDTKLKDLIGIQAVREWLNHIVLNNEVVQGQLMMTEESFTSALIAMLQEGLERVHPQPDQPQWEELKDKLKKYDRGSTSTITKALATSGVAQAAPDMEFALLTSLRSQYDAPPPILKLGTIVEEDEGDGQKRYWICVQPVCDSVRIKQPRYFPFLRLREKAVDSNEQFDFVVVDRGEYKRFKCSRRAFDMILIRMKPTKTAKSVKGKKSGGDWFFDRQDGATLRWIADLKTNHAHRLMDEFANAIKRVGLAESEWLRRMALNDQGCVRQEE